MTKSSHRLRGGSVALDWPYRQIVNALGSNYFFYATLALCILQALWYALSFVPWINDEQRHIGNIVIYSHHLSPFLGRQQPAWDYLGEITRDGSFMFYYIMSWPLRIIRLFTSDNMTQTICLRVVSIAFFSAGLVIYRKVLLELAVLPRSVINLLFFAFVTIPSVALLPGAVNYDTLVFALFAVLLLWSLRILRREVVSIPYLGGLLCIGLLLMVVKWTSIALVIPVFLYVAYDQCRKHKAGTIQIIAHAIKRQPRWIQAALGTAIVILLGLFIERPVLNVILYGQPEPSCQQVIGSQRCLQFHDYVVYAAIDAQKPKNFHPTNPARYLLVYWEPTMTDTADNLFERGASTELPVIKAVYDVMALVGIAVVLVYLRSFLRIRQNAFLILVLTTYAALLITQEYQAYIMHGAATAIRARYLIPVLPIFMYFFAVACVSMFGKFRKLLMSAVIVVLLICTQGGGIITYLLTSPSSAYWPQSSLTALNNSLRRSLRPIMVGGQRRAM